MISLKGTPTPQVLDKMLEYFGTLPNEKVKIGSGRKSHFLALASQQEVLDHVLNIRHSLCKRNKPR